MLPAQAKTLLMAQNDSGHKDNICTTKTKDLQMNSYSAMFVIRNLIMAFSLLLLPVSHRNNMSVGRF